jgi:hypothetical protein
LGLLSSFTFELNIIDHGYVETGSKQNSTFLKRIFKLEVNLTEKESKCETSLIKSSDINFKSYGISSEVTFGIITNCPF